MKSVCNLLSRLRVCIKNCYSSLVQVDLCDWMVCAVRMPCILTCRLVEQTAVAEILKFEFVAVACYFSES